MKRATTILLLFAAACGLFGCAPAVIREEITGLTVKDVERGRKKFTRVVAMDAVACVEKAGGIIIYKMKAQFTGSLVNNTTDSFFLRAIKFNKFYPNSIDTTELAVIIKPAGPGRSIVEVFSENSFLAEAVSADLFRLLEAGMMGEKY